MDQPYPSRVVVHVGVVCLCLALVSPGHARAAHSQAWAEEQFDAAERARQSLQSLPESDRTRRDYERAIDAYRRVYFGAPASTKADASVAAAAEVTAEQGRRFHDSQVLRSAIDQYEFLRREYPGSRYRVEALFAIGQIYKDDLDDPAQARAKFEEFLHRYPRNRLVDDANQALKEISQETAEKEASAKEDLARKTRVKVAQANPQDSAEEDAPLATATKPGRLTRVTGVQHWSSAGYTLVAIDLEHAVKFDSQRIENPDRIYLDLDDTLLASSLLGKTFEVDDAFVKKIRVAQYQPTQTRVVLELAAVSEYRAFLQATPPRLVIQLTQNASAKPIPGVLAGKTSNPAVPAFAADHTPTGATLTPQPVTSTISSSRTKAAPTTAASVHKAAVEEDDPPAVPYGPSPAARTSRPATQKSTVSGDPPSDEDLPGATSVKRKSPDGNNDEVATLDPTSVPVVRHSPASAPKADATSQKKGKHSKASTPDPGHEAQPTSTGDRSLIRALGLKIGRIVIDPGHGGHDTGTVGPHGLQEKDLVLDVARRLGKLLETRLGAEVVYTRDDDTFIPLETRTAIANQEQADLFVSVHANSSPDPAARGVETYYLNFTSSRDALEVAARENAVSEKTIYELQDLVKKIALKEKIDESREFAGDVESALHTGLALKSPAIRDRGVKKAPFIVLIGANMPSILAEISFVSNPTDERKLGTPDYRQRIAESLYRGIAKYVGGLSGVKVASRETRSEGQ